MKNENKIDSKFESIITEKISTNDTIKKITNMKFSISSYAYISQFFNQEFNLGANPLTAEIKINQNGKINNIIAAIGYIKQNNKFVEKVKYMNMINLIADITEISD